MAIWPTIYGCFMDYVDIDYWRVAVVFIHTSPVCPKMEPSH